MHRSFVRFTYVVVVAAPRPLSLAQKEPGYSLSEFDAAPLRLLVLVRELLLSFSRTERSPACILPRHDDDDVLSWGLRVPGRAAAQA